MRKFSNLGLSIWIYTIVYCLWSIKNLHLSLIAGQCKIHWVPKVNPSFGDIFAQKQTSSRCYRMVVHIKEYSWVKLSSSVPLLLLFTVFINSEVRNSLQEAPIYSWATRCNTMSRDHFTQILQSWVW